MIEIASKEKQLKLLEDVIEHSSTTAKKHWMEVGKALCKIRDGKLYKQKTFELYCQEKWGFKRSHALQLCHNYESLKDSKLSAAVDISGKAGKMLAAVPQERQAEVLEEASKNGKPTEKAIKEAAEKIVVADVIERDKVGHEIPTPAMKTWERKDEVREFLQAISKISSWAKKLQKTSDVFYMGSGGKLHMQEIGADCANIRRNLEDLVPYSICAVCQGQAPETCTLCHGKGMISKFTFDHGIAELTKSMMRKKANHDSLKTVSASSR